MSQTRVRISNKSPMTAATGSNYPLLCRSHLAQANEDGDVLELFEHDAAEDAEPCDVCQVERQR